MSESSHRQALSAVLFLYQQALGQQLPWMVIEDMSPQGHYVLLLYIANHLREAVDDGRISAVVLQQAADHLKMLVEHGPATRVQLGGRAMRREQAWSLGLDWRRGRSVALRSDNDSVAQRCVR